MPRSIAPPTTDAPPEPLGAHLRACRMAAMPTKAERRERRVRGREGPATGITLDELAARLAAAGWPTTYSALSKLEHGGDVRWSRARRIAAACGFELIPSFVRK